MITILNNALIETKENSAYLLNRGFRYGDGLFETIAVCMGKPRFITDHLNRLRAGASVLMLENDEIANDEIVLQHLRMMYEKEGRPVFGILRLYLYREGIGQYSPVSRMASLLLTFEASIEPEISTVSKAAFSDRCISYPSITSQFKTMSALHYVMAGMEKTIKLVDEIIIRDYRGYVCETVSSNVFWKRDDIYFTPSVETGCIAGIMRKRFLQSLRSSGISVFESLSPSEELLGSTSVFTVNALGLKHILSIENRHFSIDTLAEKIIESLG